MRSATERAAIRRGCVWPIMPVMPRPSSRQILGSWVVFPEPVSPATITTWLSRIAAAISSRRAETGNSSGYVIAGSAARRASSSCGEYGRGPRGLLPPRWFLPRPRRRRPASRRDDSARSCGREGSGVGLAIATIVPDVVPVPYFRRRARVLPSGVLFGLVFGGRRTNRRRAYLSRGLQPVWCAA